jgi:hypothetical protein
MKFWSFLNIYFIKINSRYIRIFMHRSRNSIQCFTVVVFVLFSLFLLLLINPLCKQKKKQPLLALCLAFFIFNFYYWYVSFVFLRAFVENIQNEKKKWAKYSLIYWFLIRLFAVACFSCVLLPRHLSNNANVMLSHHLLLSQYSTVSFSLCQFNYSHRYENILYEHNRKHRRLLLFNGQFQF